MNGDGFDDLLVGAPHYQASSGVDWDIGAMYIVFGSAEPTSRSIVSGTARLIGSDAYEEMAQALAGGDINGDGLGDALVGSPFNANAGADSGKVYLVFGASDLGSGTLQNADAGLTGEEVDDRAGTSVGSADINGDGYDDVLIGAPRSDTAASEAGTVYAVFGTSRTLGGQLATSDHAEWTGEAGGDMAGVSLAGVGDVDDDGFEDMLVGADYNASGGTRAGAAYLVLGSAVLSGGTLSRAPRFTGEAAEDHAGGAVAGAGDVNGDGHPDMLVGAQGVESYAGAAYLLLGLGL